jgi:hypothetical protein
MQINNCKKTLETRHNAKGAEAQVQTDEQKQRHKSMTAEYAA